MALTLCVHPFSSYSQKVLVALYENGTPFAYRTVAEPAAMEELKARWPFGRFPVRVAEAMATARQALDMAYAWLDRRLEGRSWAAGDALSLADRAAAPSLFYADWVHPIAPAFPTLRAYRSRLLAWPAYARAVDEARPYRHLFPLRTPDRD